MCVIFLSIHYRLWLCSELAYYLTASSISAVCMQKIHRRLDAFEYTVPQCNGLDISSMMKDLHLTSLS